MTVFGQGEPTQVQQSELGHFYALCTPDYPVPNWVHLFVSQCLDIRTSDKGKISIGGMVHLLVQSLGIEIPDDYATLDTTAGNTYDFAALKHIKFFIYRGREGPYFPCPNGQMLYLPPTPRHMFNMEQDEDASTITAKVIPYTRQRGVDMLGVCHVQEEAGGHEEEEAGHAEQAAPMEEDIHLAQPYQGEPYHGYYHQQVPSYDYEEDRAWRTDMLDRVRNVEGRVDRIDDQLQTLHETCTYQ
jgi:hypothetical protein